MSEIYSLIIVDDEYSACELLRRYVTGYCKDFEIAGVFNDGEEAIEFLKENDVDLVLTDIKMPRVSGIELAKYIHENKNDTNVVAVSAYSEFEYVKDLMKYGVSYYLLKFVDLDEFLEVMDIVRKNIKSKKEIVYSRYDELQAEMFFYDLFESNFSSCEEAGESYADLETDTPFDKAECTMLSFSVKGLDEFRKNRWRYTDDMLKNAIVNIIKLLHTGIFVTVLSFEEENIDLALFDRGKNTAVNTVAAAEEIKNNFGLSAENFVCESVLLKDICVGNYENKTVYTEKSTGIELADMNLPPIVRLSADIIKENFSMPIIRSEIAQKLHVNVVYLSKLFKKHTGKTLMTYLFEVRMKKAVELVREDMTISEICSRIGYGDERSFRRAFKKYTGYSVREYKRIHLRADKGESK